MNPPQMLGERYHELHALRGEALERYGRLPFPQTGGPPVRAYLPAIGRRPGPYRAVKLGPLTVTDFPPIAQVVLAEFRQRRGVARVLEIGPGRGALAGLLKAHFPHAIAAYHGLELDPHVAGPYERIADLADLREPVDVVIASEVIEHIPAETFYRDYLTRIARALAPDGVFIASVPNPLVPGGIVRDLTHVQNYPWYDLYAVLRLAFRRVSIVRTHYVSTPARLLGLVPRIVLTALQELDWAEGLIAIARDPIVPPSG